MASVRTPFRQARLSQHSACRPRIAMSVFQSPDLARIHPAMTRARGASVPGQRFGGIAPLLVFLRLRLGHVGKSAPRLPRGHDAQPGDGGKLCRLALSNRRVVALTIRIGMATGCFRLVSASGGRLCGR